MMRRRDLFKFLGVAASLPIVGQLAKLFAGDAPDGSMPLQMIRSYTPPKHAMPCRIDCLMSIEELQEHHIGQAIKELHEEALKDLAYCAGDDWFHQEATIGSNVPVRVRAGWASGETLAPGDTFTIAGLNT